jgi:predicted MPP superfamily phosphohydrolase
MPDKKDIPLQCMVEFSNMFSKLFFLLSLLSLICEICVADVDVITIAKEDVNIIAVGDWGGLPVWPYHTPGQKAVAKGMDKVAGQMGSDFVLALGDNFYFDGINGDAHNKRFEKTFQDVYEGANLQIPWYVCAGNHDHKGNVTAQLEYTTVDPTGRWIFPKEYHAHIYQANNVRVHIILLDTVELSDVSDTHLSKNEGDDGYFDTIPMAEKSVAQEQWDWLESQLSTSTADYILVGGHFPVYSACSHGNNPTLVAHLKPLLEQYDAHYLSGHDHCMNHLQETDKKVQYVLTGMGDFCCYGLDNADKVPKDSLRWYLSDENHKELSIHDLKYIDGGFTSLKASKDQLEIKYYDQGAHELFSVDSIAPRVQQ